MEKLCPCGKDNTDDHYILCDGCDTWYHGTCAELTNDEINSLGCNENDRWYCKPCLALGSSQQISEDNPILCPRCPSDKKNKLYRGQRGLKIHYGRSHKDCLKDFDTNETLNTETFAIKLSKLKKNTKILKRIPKGARVIAAKRFTEIINQCCYSNDEKSWFSLLSFTYTALKVPEKKSKNLAQAVKRNITEDADPVLKQHSKLTPSSLSRRVESKVAEGDIRGAVKLLASSDTLAPLNEVTYMKLLLKHPSPSRLLTLPDPPELNDDYHITVMEEDIRDGILLFPIGSASGLDGIRPQHFKDRICNSNGESGKLLLKSLTNLCNLMLSGKVHHEVIKILYGANLCALNKKGGGIRPIAVGSTLRRITAKVACKQVRTQLSSYFNPTQLGYGTQGGCEAAAHAVRTYISNNKNTANVILKIDFENAFNSFERDEMLLRVKENIPSLYPFLWQCYSSPSLLTFGEKLIKSAVGAQQGDPAGCICFNLVIQPIITKLQSELNVWYLDDGTLGGDPNTVLQDLTSIQEYCRSFGLKINPEKCELFFCGSSSSAIINNFQQVTPGIQVIDQNLSLLGASLTDDGIHHTLQTKFTEMKLMFSRMKDIKYHVAYFLLMNCFTLPKLTYVLRTTPTWKSLPLIHEIDTYIKQTLEEITNTKLDDVKWSKASLPIRYGGIGVRKIVDVSLPAFLSSVNSVSTLVQNLLPNSKDIVEIANYSEALEMWKKTYDFIPPHPGFQKNWDMFQCKDICDKLNLTNELDKALHLASLKKESSEWLRTLPSRAVGTLLDNNTFRISIALRLGCKICTSHVCICGEKVLEDGTHGLSCGKSAGRHSRHFTLNDVIRRGLSSAKIPSTLEPVGLHRDDGKRPDGMTIIPWMNGHTLVWDATCSDTLAPSHISLSGKEAGVIAENAAKRKRSKYKAIIEDGHHFIPFAVETLGPWCEEAIHFSSVLGKKIANETGERRATSFFRQRISIAIQKGNAACIMGTIPSSRSLEEIFYLL